jgi:DNA-binding NtrC family response regulator
VNEIELVIADLLMQVMNGVELYQKTRAWDECPPFLVMTGHSAQEAAEILI